MGWWLRSSRWAVLALLASTLGSLSAEAQELALAERGPRFLFTAAVGRAPKPVDVGRTPVLRRRIALEVDGATLAQALAEITRQSGLAFVYSRDVISPESPVRLRAEQITVAAALTELLLDAGVDVLLSSGMQAALVKRGGVPVVQPGSLGGRVTDGGTGEALAGAEVLLEGTRWRTTTGEDGRYRLAEVEPGSYTLVARRIGYGRAALTVAIESGVDSVVDIALEPVATRLEELVATATGEQPRYRIGNAIATILPDSVLRTAPVQNLGELVAGRAPGVQVQFTNGAFGLGPQFRIRGINSMSLSNDPIVVIDGVRVDNSSGKIDFNPFAVALMSSGGRLADINPEEIESVDIVKGPSAATLYGTDAANGVIVIKTKRGVAGPPRWHFYMEQGVNDTRPHWFTNYYGWGTNLGTGAVQQCRLLDVAAGICRQDSLTTRNPMLQSPFSPLGTGYLGTYGVQVAGGSPGFTYLLSGEYQRERGYIRMSPADVRTFTALRGGVAPDDDQLNPNGVRKVGLRGNATVPFRKGEISVSTGFVSNRTNLPDGNIFNVASLSPGVSDTLTEWLFGARPFYFMAATSVEQVNHFTGSVGGSYRPRPWLTTRGTLGVDYSDNNLSYLVRRGEGSIFTPLGLRVNQDLGTTLYSVDLGASAAARLSSDIGSTTSIGAQYNRRQALTTGVAASGLPPGAESAAGAASVTGYESTVQSVVAGAYVEQTLGYHERLFLTGALRLDGGSAFGRNFKTIAYPKASLSWLALDGSSQPLLGLTSLRLRAAYGSSGVQPSLIASLARDSLFTGISGGVPDNAAAVLSNGNPDLKPERQTEIEAGFEAEWFAGRIRLEATAYNRRSTDAIVDQPYASSFGLGTGATQQINIGAVRNRGLEGLLNVRVLNARSVNWDVGLNGFINQNRILRLAPGVASTGGTYRQVPGYPVNGIWERKILGYQDANDDGILEPDEISVTDTAVFIGSPLPSRELTGTTTIGLFGDAVRVSALFDYRGGHVRWNNVAGNRCGEFFPADCRGINDPAAPLAEQAAAVVFDRYNSSYAGYMEDGEFLRLRELALTLTASPRIARLLRARSASLTLSARNLWVATGYTGIDPEGTNAPGADRIADNPTTPLPRSFIMRLDLGL